MLSVLLSALCPPAPLKSLTFWHYTNQIIIIIIMHVRKHRPIVVSSWLISSSCWPWVLCFRPSDSNLASWLFRSYCCFSSLHLHKSRHITHGTTQFHLHWCLSVSGHTARLDAAFPANGVLRLAIDIREGRRPDMTWVVAPVDLKQGDHSFSTMIFHDFSMTKKKNFHDPSAQHIFPK